MSRAPKELPPPSSPYWMGLALRRWARLRDPGDQLRWSRRGEVKLDFEGRNLKLQLVEATGKRSAMASLNEDLELGLLDGPVALLLPFRLTSKGRKELERRRELGLVWDQAQLLEEAQGAWNPQVDPLEAMAALVPGAPRLAQVLEAGLCAQLQAEGRLKLSSLGESGDQRLWVHEVFQDLPLERGGDRALDVILQRSLLGPPTSQPSDRDDPDPGSIFGDGWEAGERRPLLLTGGPGQGKSTISQMLAQVLRAELLRRRRLEPTLKAQVGVLRSGAEGRWAAPGLPRLPLRVELAVFAEQLHRNKGLLLLDHIAARFARGEEGTLGSEQLLALVQGWPTLLILDGWDEVPPGEPREQVRRAVEALVRQAGPELLLLYTSRPQAVGGELGQAERLDLAPLERADALTLVGRLLSLRHPGDPATQAEQQERFERETEEGHAAELLGSPLQVSILSALIEEGGSAPPTRLRLFEEYFHQIYRREQRKELRGLRLLADQRDLVVKLHEEVGLWLHLRSEEEEGDNQLDEEELEALIYQLLLEAGHGPQERERLALALLRGALERLVLLISPAPGRLCFELRSLQEYFAARALRRGSEAQLQLRYMEIMPFQHWQNVWLFLTELLPEHLEGLAAQLCAQLNHPQGNWWQAYQGKVQWLPYMQLASVGTRRAIDLWTSGWVGTRPALAKQLWAAMEALPLSPQDRALVQLVKLSSAEQRNQLLAWAREWAEQAKADPRPWALLVLLAEAKEERGALLELLQARGPEALALLERGFAIDGWGGEPNEKLWSLALSWPLREGRGLLNHLGSDMLREALRTAEELDLPLVAPVGEKEVSRLLFRSHAARWRALPFHQRFHPDWTPLWALSRFAAGGGEGALEAILDQMREPSVQLARLDFFLPYLPWPLAWALSRARAAPPGANLREQPQHGELPPSERWAELEAAWSRGLAPSGGGGPEARLQLEQLPHSRLIQAAAGFRLRAPASALGPSLREALAPRGLLPPEPKAASLLTARLTRLAGLEVSDGEFNGALEELAAWPEPLESLPLPMQLVADFGAALDGRRLSEGSWPGVARLRLAFALRSRMYWDQRGPLAPRDPLSLPRLLSSLPAAHPALRMDLLRLAASYTPFAPEHSAAVAEGIIRELEENPQFGAALGAMPPRMYSAALLDLLRPHLSNFPPEVAEGLRLAARNLWMGTTSFLIDQQARRALGLRDHEALLPPPPRPFRLDHLRLQHIRGITSLELELRPAQWRFFIGDNGVGKSSLLRAIGLALAPQAIGQGLLGLMPAGLVQRGASGGEVELHLSAQDLVLQPVRLQIKAGQPELLEKHGEASIFCVAYGPRRGGALGSAKEAADLSLRFHWRSLYDDGAGLIDAEGWLRDRAFEATGGGPPQRYFEELCELLARVLEVDRVEVRPGVGVLVSGAQVGQEMPLACLSEGYLTTAGWIIDLLARWKESRRGSPIPKDFARHMTGVVLIDEIDLHLHPVWQWDLVSRLREIFPNLSVVATTHNPVTLLGARPGEVLVLRRDPQSGAVSALPLDPPAGASVNDLLTSGLFGMTMARSQETHARLLRHLELTRSGEAPEERLALEQELRLQLGGFLDSSLERLAWRAAAEVLEEEAQGLRQPEAQARLAEIKARMQQRRNQG